MAKIIDEIVVAVSKEELKKVYKKHDNIEHADRHCCICKSDKTNINPNGSYAWRRYKIDKDGNFSTEGLWDGKSYVCNICHAKQRYELKGKTKAKFRNKQLSRNSESGKGYIGEQIWCKVRGVKNCNIETDNFHCKYDHSPDPKYGIVNTKYAVLTKTNTGKYSYERWEVDTKGECNNIVCICMSSDETNVERVYIIPKIEVKNEKPIAIYTSTKSKWEKYRIDETPYNTAYHSMSLKDCNVLKDEKY